MSSNITQTDIFSPKVDVKKKLKKVIVSGRSRMSDPGQYYIQLSDKLVNYFLEFRKNLFLEFYFDYVNTGSSKWLVDLLQRLDSVQRENGGIIEVTWKYDIDDETILETGEILKSQFSIPVVLKGV